MRKISLILCLLFSGILFAQNPPYNVNKRKFPLGEDFRKIIPEKIGEWDRFAFHDFIPGQEDGTVFYEKGTKEIAVIFGKAQNQDDMKIIWAKLCDKATENGKEKEVKLRNNTNPSVKYLLMDGSNYLYAWTRNLYYFYISTKYKADADDFMKSFPW